MENIYNDIKRIIPKGQLLLNEPMKNHTSFRIGGPADIMVLPSNEDEIIKVLTYCSGRNVPIFVMGNGSNLLVRDKVYGE